MTVKTINLDKDAELCLEKKKNSDPYFNFSSFIQDKLKEEHVKEENLHEIELNIERKRTQINQLSIEVANLEAKKTNIENKIKFDKDEAERKKIAEEVKRVEFIKNYIGNLTFFYVITEEFAEVIAKEVWETPQECRKGLFEDAKERGLIEREEKKNGNK